MDIQTHIPGEELSCHFRGLDFDLQRDTDDDPMPGQWYIVVTDGDGHTLYDGWARDSEGWDEREAMVDACEGSMVKPPKRWPAQLRRAA